MNMNESPRYSETFDINSLDYSAPIDLDIRVSVLENKNLDNLNLFLMRHRSAESGIFMIDSLEDYAGISNHLTLIMEFSKLKEAQFYGYGQTKYMSILSKALRLKT